MLEKTPSHHWITSELLKLEEFPTLEPFRRMIIESMSDEDASAVEVTRLIERDHAISLRALRLANSAYYGLSRKVESIRRAVIALGFETIRQIALATSVIDTFEEGAVYGLDLNDFWTHSFGVAHINRRLCLRLGRAEESNGFYTAGLLHDMGKYLLAITLQETYGEVIAEAEATGESLHRVERRRFGVDHALVGSWLAKTWSFPPLLVESARNLYEPGLSVERYRVETAAVVLSDRIAARVGLGRAGEPSLPDDDQDLLVALGLSGTDLRELERAGAGFRDECHEMFRCLQGNGSSSV